MTDAARFNIFILSFFCDNQHTEIPAHTVFTKAC